MNYHSNSKVMSYTFKRSKTLSSEVRHTEQGYTITTTDLTSLCPLNGDWKSFELMVVSQENATDIVYYKINGVEYLLDHNKQLQEVGQN